VIAHLIAGLTPRWHKDAACRGEPSSTFFPPPGGKNKRAFEICGRCPVRENCLTAALDDEQGDFGIRAGMSANARKVARRERKAGRRA
jgi:WhiB family redox-sensing transcriptional regulator